MADIASAPLALTRRTVEFNASIPARHFMAYVEMLTVEFPELDLTIRGIRESDVEADRRIVSFRIRAEDVPHLTELSRTFCQNTGITKLEDFPS